MKYFFIVASFTLAACQVQSGDHPRGRGCIEMGMDREWFTHSPTFCVDRKTGQVFLESVTYKNFRLNGVRPQ